jgi:hypothetical protein
LAELAVNRRTAPDLYLGVMAVTRQADGRLQLGGDGMPVDWLVEMRRFDGATLFDRMAAEGRLTAGLLLQVADAVARLHAGAETTSAWGGEAGIRFTIDTNAASFAAFVPQIFEAAVIRRLTEASRTWLARLAPLLEARRLGGRVRRCHGDLHLGNICMVDGRPTLFDAIEFNDDFACIDVLYDVAFLLMDLHFRGLGSLATDLLGRYLASTDDLEGLAALPLFLSLRAAIRAHVSAATATGGDHKTHSVTASAYLERAIGYLSPPPPRLVAVGGLSGSGKSRLARLLAPVIGAAPGALVLRTDVLRKRLAGVAPEVRLPPDAYGKAMTERTYRALCRGAERALAAGHAVIADAVFARPEQRAAIEGVAVRLGVAFDGLWLEADAAVMRERIEGRRHNASDATVAVLEQQLQYPLGAITWQRLNSTGAIEEAMENARKLLRL